VLRGGYADPTTPKLITWAPGFAGVHRLSISDDGTRGYFVSPGGTTSSSTDLTNPNVHVEDQFRGFELLNALRTLFGARAASRLFKQSRGRPIGVDKIAVIVAGSHISHGSPGGKCQNPRSRAWP
jgi:hypothetical protein